MVPIKTASPAAFRRAFPHWKLLIAPSVLSADFSDLKNELKRIEKAKCSWVHLDIMDGHFVPNITFGPPVIKALRKVSDTLFFDAHLMIEKPMKFATDFAEAGVQLLTFHQETVGSPRHAIRKIHSLGMLAGLSVKPRTPVAVIEPFLDEVDLVLIMTVEPGFGGQAMIPSMLNKVRRLALLREEKKYSFHIQVDGGINDKTAALATAAGANVLVAGSYVFGGRNMKQNIDRLVGTLDPKLHFSS